MLHRDFLMRTIERLAQAFFNLIAGQQVPPEQREQSIEDALSEHLNIDPLFLFSHLEETLRDTDSRLAFQIGRLLEVYGDSKLERGVEYQRAFQFAARFMAKSLGQQLESDTEALASMGRIARRVPLTDACYETLIESLRERGRYEALEDVVFISLEHDASAARVSKALSLFRALEQESDDVIEQGGLSRPEIEDAIEQLQQMG